MIAVAGGILLAMFVVLVLGGLVLCARDIFRFAMRHKPYTFGLLGALALCAALSIAGSYDTPYQSKFVQR